MINKNLNKPLIVWEKWMDPFGSDTNEAKWTDYNNDLSSFQQLDGEHIDDEVEEEGHIVKLPEQPIKVIASPLGLIPYHEHTASGKIFNFWIGHTNFNISDRIKSIIETSDGVEILDIFTRYRFRIAIGKCFDDAQIMSSITHTINNLYDETTK